MTIANQRGTPEELAFFKKTIENATRLAEDAKLLCESNRAASAMMLAILAVEELGKALITMWGTNNKASKKMYPTHIEKQGATFALLAAYEAAKMSKARLRRKLAKTGGNFMEMGPLSAQFAHARAGFFDDVRMAVTYADYTPKIPIYEIENGVHVDLAKEILSWFELARRAMYHISAMKLASTIFENDLGRM